MASTGLAVTDFKLIGFIPLIPTSESGAQNATAFRVRS